MKRPEQDVWSDQQWCSALVWRVRCAGSLNVRGQKRHFHL
jgi:hypothetical protein